MSDIKKVISQRLVSHEDRTGKKTSLVDIFSALRKNNDARILRHTRLDDSHSTVYITNNKNGYKVYEKKGKGNKVSKKVYKVNNKNKLKNILKKSAKNLKEKFDNNNGNNADTELDLVPDINNNEEEYNVKNHIQNKQVHNTDNNLKDYEQLMMEDLEKNVVVKKENKKTKKKNKRNKRKNKKNKKKEDVKILSNEKVLYEKTKKRRNRRKRKRSRKGKKN